MARSGCGHRVVVLTQLLLCLGRLGDFRIFQKIFYIGAQFSRIRANYIG
jgi:hypothetical protein